MSFDTSPPATRRGLMSAILLTLGPWAIICPAFCHLGLAIYQAPHEARAPGGLRRAAVELEPDALPGAEPESDVAPARHEESARHEAPALCAALALGGPRRAALFRAAALPKDVAQSHAE